MTSRASWQDLLMLVGAGVLLDIAVNETAPGLTLTVFFWLVAIRLLPAIPHRGANAWALAAAAVLSITFTLRDAPDLWVLNLAAISALLGLAVTWREPVSAASLSLLFRSATGLIRAAFRIPGFLLSPLAPLSRRLKMDRLKPGLRTAAIALPIIAVFALLLATADRVFAEVITPTLPDWSLSGVMSHIIPIGIGTFCVSVLWYSCSMPDVAASNVHFGIRIRVTDWTTVLAGVNLLFAVFVVVQFASLFGGNHRVEVTPGLTYAEYARSGFFQLIAVAGLVLALVLSTWTFGDRRSAPVERRFRVLITTMILMTFVILASAFHRLALYESAFGYTLLRLYAMVALAIIGVVLMAALAYIWIGKRELLSTAMVTALVALIVLNLTGSGEFVAQRNADRFRATGKIDAGYNSRLRGADAVPAIAELARLLTGRDSDALREGVCQQFEQIAHDAGLRGWNVSRSAARKALARAGITADSCDF